MVLLLWIYFDDNSEITKLILIPIYQQKSSHSDTNENQFTNLQNPYSMCTVQAMHSFLLTHILMEKRAVFRQNSLLCNIYSMDTDIQDLPMSSLRDLSEQRILTPEPHLNRYLFISIFT